MLLRALLESDGAALDELKPALAQKRPGARSMVAQVEDEIADAPSSCITFDEHGSASVATSTHRFPGGRFRVASIGELKARAQERRARSQDGHGRVRLSVISGSGPLTDIGALQATAGPGTLFQVASQFNCLEAPGPDVAWVQDYFSDPTQGPRASISAFPATLVRHYAAPGSDGRRFVQGRGAQLNLLARAAPSAKVQNGYLTAQGVDRASELVDALEANFEQIQVGVHDDVQVVLGAHWDGAVDGDRRIAQVFTSTFAGGRYSRGAAIEGSLEQVCRSLLRAAYLGTLLAAVSLGKSRVVLTMIGGGAFANPHRLIWESILWACDQADAFLSASLDVVLNGRDVGKAIDPPLLRSAVEARGGVLVVCR